MHLSEIELKMMAKEASKQYLDNNVPLTDTVAKLASDRQLNPHQIARICEAANLDTYNAMWNKVGSGNFVFEVADQDKVVEKLAAMDTSSPLLDEYISPASIKDLLPDEKDTERIPTDKLLSIPEKKAALEKTSFEIDAKPFLKAKAIKLANQLKAYISELNSAIAEVELQKKEAELKFHDMLKVAALRGENIVPVYVAARAVNPNSMEPLKELFEDAFTKVSNFGVDFKKQAKQISEDAEGNRRTDYSAINKNHPILKTISTILEADELTPRLSKTKEYLVKKVEILDDMVRSEKFDNDGLANDTRTAEDR